MPLEEKPSNSNARILTTAHWHASPETVDSWYGPSSNPSCQHNSNSFLKVVLIVRFSVIPSHFSTAVFSTCNVKFWYFAVATFATLPKQIILVYVGVLFAQKNKNNTINDIVLVITFLITVAAGAYIYNKMRLTKRLLLDEQAARLDAKQRNLSQEFDFQLNVDVREGDDQWQRERHPDSPSYVSPPMQARWTEETHEMGDMGRHRAHPQEFI